MVTQKRFDHIVAMATEEKARLHVRADAKAPTIGLALGDVVPTPDEGDPRPTTSHANFDVETKIDETPGLVNVDHDLSPKKVILNSMSLRQLRSILLTTA